MLIITPLQNAWRDMEQNCGVTVGAVHKLACQLIYDLEEIHRDSGSEDGLARRKPHSTELFCGISHFKTNFQTHLH